MKAAGFALALLCSATALAAAEVTKEEFAYEASIVSASASAIVRAPLTAEVYRGVTRPDLGDMRAYNSAGDMLAHSIDHAPSETTRTLITLPVFPSTIAAGAAVEQLVNKVVRDADGAIVSVQTRTARPDDRTVYLVDATSAKDPLAALEVSWDSSVEFLGTLVVEGSADLRSWRELARGTLANLVRESNTLRQDRIELPARSALKYLRLSWANADPGSKVPVTGIRAEIRKRVGRARDWLEIAAVPGAEPGDYRFDADGNMPVDRVRVRLPANTVARVALLSRAKGTDRWVWRAQKTVFFVEGAGTQLRDDEIQVPRVVGHQWLLQVHRQGDGVGGQSPRVELGWVPDDVVVVTKGAPPFTLAFGHARTVPADFGVDELVRRSRREGEAQLEIATATLGPARVLRGDPARERPWYQRDWKQWLLWSVLLLGVAILGVFAARLMRQAREP